MTVPEVNQDDIKKALKEGLKEWLDEKFAMFGKWTLASLAASGLVAIVYVILLAKGFKLN